MHTNLHFACWYSSGLCYLIKVNNCWNYKVTMSKKKTPEVKIDSKNKDVKEKLVNWAF